MYLQKSELTRLIQKANKLYRQCCHFLAEVLNSQLGDIVEFIQPNGGMALWLQFNTDFQLVKIIEKTSARGLKIMGSAYYQGNNSPYNGFRFGFTSLNEDELIFG